MTKISKRPKNVNVYRRETVVYENFYTCPVCHVQLTGQCGATQQKNGCLFQVALLRRKSVVRTLFEKDHFDMGDLDKKEILQLLDK